MRERCRMLIMHTRTFLRADRIVSIFWSNNLLCQVGRSTIDTAWIAHIRLWPTHPWIPHEDRLDKLTRSWLRQAVQVRPLCDCDDIAVLDKWVAMRSTNPRVPIRSSLVKPPDQYWYQAALPKRDKKHYRLAKTYMESLCCSLCDFLCYTP